MRLNRFLALALVLLVQATFAHADVITIKTGQVGGYPGSCAGLDGNFNYYAPQLQCGQPILPTPFSAADFDSACSGPPAGVIDAHPAWAPDLPCDPDARWITSTLPPGSCYGSSVSVLYCAPFHSECMIADSVKVCWQVDDGLGDIAGYGGPNTDGVYVNGISLGSAFTGGNRLAPTTAVAYGVVLTGGLNNFQVYQRDAGCSVAGLILSATIYTSCGTTPTETRSWGSIKSMYR